MDRGKRLGIFAMYCQDGQADDYIIYYLSQIKRCLSALVVVSNVYLTDESREKIGVWADFVFEREDTGFDCAGLRAVMVHDLGWDRIREYEEVVFMNDSVFGPFYPFEEVFGEMEKRKELDFWGLCKRGRSDFDGGETIFPEHIQLYFYAVRKKMICSQEFETFWDELEEKIQNFRTAIFQYEFVFTKYFEKLGYRWDVYCCLKGYDTADPKKNLSPYHYGSYELIKKQRCPVLKRKLFTGDFVWMKYSGREDLKRAVRFIQEETDYDTGLIWRYVLAHYHLHDIMDSMKLCFTLSGRHGTEGLGWTERISLYQLSDFHMPVEQYFSNVHRRRREKVVWNELILVIAWEGCSDAPQSVTESETYRIIENLAESEDYIRGVLQLFDENRELGILVPPVPLYGIASQQVLSPWRNPDRARTMYQKLNLRVPFDAARAPVPAMTAFWCRREIMDNEMLEFISANEKEDVISLIPLYAQQKGYYTAYVQSSTYAGIEYCNQQKFITDLLKQMEARDCQTTDDILDQIQENRLEGFCNKNSRIIIYGGGQLAVRAAKTLEKIGRDFKYFVVTNLADNESRLYGHDVCEVEEITDRKQEVGIIVAVGKNHNEEVLTSLKLRGFCNLHVFQA